MHILLTLLSYSTAMRKKLIWLLIIGFSSITVFGQNAAPVNHFNVNSALGVYNVSTPNMASFQKVTHIPMNPYTGRANVTIPLYEIKSGDLSVPISISYNTSGVKVDDIPSSVGSNWSLSAGGSISKTVKGLEDFYYKAEESPQSKDYYVLKSLGWSHRLDYAATKSIKTLLGTTLPFTLPAKSNGSDLYSNAFNLQTKNDDSRPDLFTANAPGLSTSFVHRMDKTVMELQHQGNTIVSAFGESNPISLFGFNDGWEGTRPIKCITNINVTNPQGVTYQFGHLDISQTADTLSSKSSDRRKKYEVYSYNQVDTYHLSSMQSSATHKEIKFNYNRYTSENEEVKISQVESYSGGSFDKGIPITPFIYPAQLLKTKHPQLNRINTITFEEGSVEFIHAKNREDLIGGRALTTIIVRDFHGTVIKTLKFEYSYFKSSFNCTTPECKRLRLDKIRVFSKTGAELPGYTFSYDITSLPPRGTYNQDFLGYANGLAIPKEDTPAFPKLYFSVNKGKYSFFPVSLGQDYRELPGDYSMIPDLKYAKAGVLTSIQYPTGASTQFSYELNSFLIGTKEIQGGGLRIKSQRIIDKTGHQEILDYRYLDTDWKPSGRLNAIPTYANVKIGYGDSTDGNLEDLLFEVYSSSQFQAELTDGAYVGYSRVLIKNRENHGITENIYTSSKDEPNIQAPIYDVGTLFKNEFYDVNEPSLDFYNQNGGLQNILIDKGLFRGKLKLQRLYDSTGKLIQRTNITYTKDLLDSFSVDHIQVEGDFIDTFGEPASRAKYYSQKFDLSSQRHMKTSEIVKDYYKDGTTKITQTSQKYHSKFPVLKEQTATNSLGIPIKNIFYYPDEKASLSDLSTTESLAIDHLIGNKRYTIPIQTESYIGDTKTQTQRTSFKTWQNSITAPASQQTAKKDAVLEDRVTYKQYDASGNVISVSQTNGTEISYIYGYKNSVIIAALKNVSYQDIPQATITQLQQLSDNDKDTATEQTLKDALDALRTTFTQGQITTYTYTPLIGVTSITNPAGMTTYYQYDDFNRLQTIKDHYGKILKEYCYGYKGVSNPCNRTLPVGDLDDIIGNESSKVYIEVGAPKDYQIPIPDHLDAAEYYWPEIDNTEYKYKSLHPVLYFPRPRLVHGDGFPSNSINLQGFNLLYPTEYYSSGWTTSRKGMSYKLVGKDLGNNADIVVWGIVLANGKEIPISTTIPELTNVLFPVFCLNGVKGKIFCRIVKTGPVTPVGPALASVDNIVPVSSEIYYSKPILFTEGLSYLDRSTPYALSSSTVNACEIIAGIAPVDTQDTGTTEFDLPWSYSDWDVNLEQDADYDSMTVGGSGIRNTELERIKVHLNYGKYRIPIPNDFKAQEYEWTEGNRPSLHPVFYYPRPHLIDDITVPSASQFNSIFKRHYPDSYYSSGWYVERGGYRYSITGLEVLSEEYTTEWFIAIGNTKHKLEVFIPETTELFFIPRKLIGQKGQVVCRVTIGSSDNPSKIMDIKSEVTIFKEGLAPSDLGARSISPFDLQN
ncbi:RHS repeat domain-containing protein [Aquimarina longa]|uniref:RHS repeat domain-containing protein n=1 Tax=Aquimarina longa TaxID=1080221 RepID=UPI000784927B|nr:RHS repeat domain-containing protein [Aquimarina longa]